MNIWRSTAVIALCGIIHYKQITFLMLHLISKRPLQSMTYIWVRGKTRQIRIKNKQVYHLYTCTEKSSLVQAASVGPVVTVRLFQHLRLCLVHMFKRSDMRHAEQDLLCFKYDQFLKKNQDNQLSFAHAHTHTHQLELVNCIIWDVTNSFTFCGQKYEGTHTIPLCTFDLALFSLFGLVLYRWHFRPQSASNVMATVTNSCAQNWDP